jgi:hypothetical protein
MYMQHSPVSSFKEKAPREIDFEIGDSVCLRSDPNWVGVVVARTLSANVNVLWDEHGIEQIDRRLLQLSPKRSS